MSIPYAYFFDQFFFHEALNGVSLAAALVILSFAFAVAVYKIRLNQLNKR